MRSCRPGPSAAASVATRDVGWAGPGLLRVRQHLQLRNREPGADATGPYWVFAVVQLHRGALRYLHGREHVAPPGRRFAVFMPPWSIVRAAPASAVVSTDAIASDMPVLDGVPGRPVAWRWRGGPPPRTLSGIAKALRAAGSLVEVSREVAPAAAARRAKAVVDEAYCRPVTLARLAAQVGCSASTMSRAFRSGYGMPPVEYRHRLRVMDAMFRLASGGAILTVLEEVGFGDVSRFYRHFQGLLCSPPGSYAARRSRNAKN